MGHKNECISNRTCAGIFLPTPLNMKSGFSEFSDFSLFLCLSISGSVSLCISLTHSLSFAQEKQERAS